MSNRKQPPLTDFAKALLEHERKTQSIPLVVMPTILNTEIRRALGMQPRRPFVALQ